MIQSVVITDSHIGTYELHPIHRLANIRPMNETEWLPFRDSIGKHGLLYPIIRWEKLILNGANRLRACLETSTPPKFTELEDMPLFRRCKTRPEQEEAAKIIVKMVDLDRRQLSPREIADAIARMYPPKPRGRPAQTPENTGEENGSAEPFTRPSDAELAKQHGISHATLKRARQEDEDEKKVREGCIPSVQAAVGKEFTARAAANLAGLPAGQQKKTLRIFRESKGKISLVAAMSRVLQEAEQGRGHRNEELPGQSKKTTMIAVEGIQWYPEEALHLAVEAFERSNLEMLEQRGIDTEKYRPEAKRVGFSIGGIKSFIRCARCGLMIQATDDTRKVEGGVAHRECPNGARND